MPKYIFPAVFTGEKEGYSVRFPDLKSCSTSGISLEEALEMAKDALCLMLYDMEEEGEMIPMATDIQKVDTKPDEFVSLISCDTLEYRKLFDSKAVKKTLTIPAWLNTMAERAGVNFSTTLQAALKQELNVQ